MYLLTHKLKTSPEITALYKEIADSPEKYKGHAATAIMLGSLFHP
ncbi:bacteriocin [Streptococcus infantarius subsp. infantarius CJ18]|nr:bacteriocin [Streptococcus infantarius subsp. infantarius CJ18]